MIGLPDLKPKIKITDTTVECPVMGCNKTVERQKRQYVKADQFRCPVHEINISPSTFEYDREEQNLLWYDSNDQTLFKEISKVKRESRITHDNSEDAVSWNVFRYFDRNNYLGELMHHISGETHDHYELIYWSYSPSERKNWSYLNKARIEFGETIERGSEPDLIVLTAKTIFFIEAKVHAGNNTKPSSTNRKKYVEGGQNWFDIVAKSSFETIAIESKKYELIRLWLIGSWLAQELNLKFHLVNLVLDKNDKSIEEIFGKHIRQSPDRKFSRNTWEGIHDLIKNKEDADSKRMIEFFHNKSGGYDSQGNLKSVFSVR